MNRLRVELWSDDQWIDISADVEAGGWSVSWTLANTVHRTARIVLRRRLVWATTRLRLSGVSSEVVEVFPLGVFSTKTPARQPGSVPELFEVECYDPVADLRWSPGVTLSLGDGDDVIEFVESVLGAVGPVSIDQTDAGFVASADQLFPLDVHTTRSTIANTVLASIGYRPVWSDPVTGAFRSEPDVSFGDLASVHTFDSSSAQASGLREDRTFTEDDWSVPNQVIGIVDDPSLSSPLSFVRNNVSEGPASQDVVGIRPTVLRVQAQDVTRLEALVNAELGKHMRELSAFELSADWVPAITGGHVCTVRVLDSSVPIDRRCVVESWVLESDFSMRLKVSPPPQSFPAGVGIAEAVKVEQDRVRLRGQLPAVIVSTSPLVIRFLGDPTDVPVPLVSSGLSLSAADVVQVGKLGVSWGVTSKLVAS